MRYWFQLNLNYSDIIDAVNIYWNLDFRKVLVESEKNDDILYAYGFLEGVDHRTPFRVCAENDKISDKINDKIKPMEERILNLLEGNEYL